MYNYRKIRTILLLDFTYFVYFNFKQNFNINSLISNDDLLKFCDNYLISFDKLDMLYNR